MNTVEMSAALRKQIETAAKEKQEKSTQQVDTVTVNGIEYFFHHGEWVSFPILMTMAYNTRAPGNYTHYE